MKKTSTQCLYRFAIKRLLFMLLSVNLMVPVFSQQLKISGTVTDSKTGEPLLEAGITLEGTTTGTVTDVNGNYTLSVPKNSVLVFSYVGYISQNVTVTEQGTYNVQLVENVRKLNEIVVVGYGTQRKEAVTGSVATMNGSEVRDVPSSNVSRSLQGRIAGVEMSPTSSKPGAPMQIRIRGTRSLTASNDPLIVLDGIPFAGSISDIDPDNIKSINILKDASATAIYGSRGANGVILITTNRGQAGQKAQVTYNAYYGTKKVFAPYPMMNGPEFIKLRAAAGQYTNGEDESNDVNTNWQDLFYRPGMLMNHDLAVSGGTQTGSYNFGLGYYHDVAVVPGQDYSRFSLHGTMDQEVGKFFHFGFTTNDNFSISNGSNLNMYNVLSASPIANPYNADGTFKRTIKMPLDETWVETRKTVDNLGDSWIDQNKGYGSYNNLFGEVTLPGIKGLKYRVNLGLNLHASNHGSYTGEGVFSSTATTLSTASVSNALTTDWAVENLLTYDRTFKEKHALNIVALYSAEQTKYDRSYFAARDIPSDAFQFYNLGQASGELTANPDSQQYQVSGLESWMGRVMYSYDNRYMLMATLRSDGSSRLAPGHKWHTYPAISAGWNIKNESFMDNIDAINFLKLRVGYGQTSNQSIAPYATLGRLSTRPYNFGDNTYAVGTYVTELPNDNLGWEYSKTWNYGLDFTLLNNRLSGTLEYYITHTKDILLSVNLPNTSGVNSYNANIGETQNKGLELSLNGTILDNVNGWTWEAGVNVYGNRNKLIALASGESKDEANWWFVGKPINVIFDYDNVGLWQVADTALMNILEPGGNVGMIRVKYTGDYNADGTPARAIGPDDRIPISIDPKFQGGFNTRLAYKGFDLTAVGIFKSGGILISTLYSSFGYLNLMSGRRNNVNVDYWTPENTGAKYPKPGGLTSGDNPKYGSTLGYFNASYLKISTLTFGYNFNKKWIKNAGIDNLRLYATVQNPFVMFSPFHKETGLDPETNSYANDAQTAAVSNFGLNAASSPAISRLLILGTNTPSTRNYLIGINLTF